MRLITSSLLIVIFLSLSSCITLPKGPFDSAEILEAPDYGDLFYWAASPFKEDNADRVPEPYLIDRQSESPADVFFLHPTTYTDQPGNNEWNGPLLDEKLNQKTDNGTILFQASVFNGAGRVFAPRYRQAHYHAFFTKSPEKRKKAHQAIDFAYRDIEKAFLYYLENHNNGRPIVLASHSQGTAHAIRLIQEHFEGKPLMKQLVVAYLVGYPVRKDDFSELSPCVSDTDLTCFCSWRSYLRDYLPKYSVTDGSIVVTNPLKWTLSQEYVPSSANKGTLLTKFENGLHPGISDAQIYNDHLWINKPKFKGSFFIRFKNYHVADYNLFYANLRENAWLRVEQFMLKQ